MGLGHSTFFTVHINTVITSNFFVTFSLLCDPNKLFYFILSFLMLVQALTTPKRVDADVYMTPKWPYLRGSMFASYTS